MPDRSMQPQPATGDPMTMNAGLMIIATAAALMMADASAQAVD